MTATSGALPGAATIGGVLAEATRSAGSSSELAIAAGQVIVKRVALGVAAAMDPLRADRTEFERMMPEKLEAFSAAGLIVFRQSGRAGRHLAHLASDAAVTATRATLAMADCRNPAALVQAQRSFTLGWLDRIATHCIAMSMLALGVQEAAMVPIRRTVAANAARLNR